MQLAIPSSASRAGPGRRILRARDDHPPDGRRGGGFSHRTTTIGSSGLPATKGGAQVNADLVSAASGLLLRCGVRGTGGSVDVDGNDAIDLTGSDKKSGRSGEVCVDGCDPECRDRSHSAAHGRTRRKTRGRTRTPAGSRPMRSSHPLTETRRLWRRPGAWTSSGATAATSCETREKAKITVWLNSYDNAAQVWDLGSGVSDPYVDSSGDLLLTNTEFTLEIKPRSTGIYTLHRVTPVTIDAPMDLK